MVCINNHLITYIYKQLIITSDYINYNCYVIVIIFIINYNFMLIPGRL